MKEKIQVGYVGLGRRGTLMLTNCFGEMDDVEIATLCELDGEKLEKGREALEKKGRPAPALYTDYSAMLQHPGLDAVIIMTGWNARVKYAIEAMRAGKYTAIEVGCAYDLSECFDLVKAYEETGAPVMRALFYEFPQDAACWDVADQFMFGPDILVAPVCHEKAQSRSVYLPAGAQWTHAGTGEVYAGGQAYDIDAPISTLPVFLRDGRQDYLIGKI